ncbi:MAG: alpha/beta fold hydrolase [Gemmatimonadaceae bacterium]|nr:alpha/beta fold hydrolase [Gemmatimonadaceae bacterium]
MTATRLAPAEWFPHGWEGITARRVTLPGGVTLRVVEAGPENGLPVVLLHGWGVSAYLWRHTLRGLAAAGYRCYAPDLPGHGLSDAPSAKGAYSLGAFAGHIEALFDALGLDRPVVIAQSMGGRIAAELAVRGRSAQLGLFGAVGFGQVTPVAAYAPFIPEIVPAIVGDLAPALVTRQMVEMVQRRVHGKLGWFTARDVDEYWAPTQFPATVRAQLQMLREFPWEPLSPAMAGALGVETLVVFGTADRTVRPRDTAAIVTGLPAGRLEWVEGGGHVVMEEVPDRVNSMLVEFLGSRR